MLPGFQRIGCEKASVYEQKPTKGEVYEDCMEWRDNRQNAITDERPNISRVPIAPAAAIVADRPVWKR